MVYIFDTVRPCSQSSAFYTHQTVTMFTIHNWFCGALAISNGKLHFAVTVQFLHSSVERPVGLSLKRETAWYDVTASLIAAFMLKSFKLWKNKMLKSLIYLIPLRRERTQCTNALALMGIYFHFIFIWISFSSPAIKMKILNGCVRTRVVRTNILREELCRRCNERIKQNYVPAAVWPSTFCPVVAELLLATRNKYLKTV